MLHRGTRWVMRVARLSHCQDERGAKELVDAFADWDLTASPSRLSRWEYGHSGGSGRLLRAYESGCDLPPYLLFALNDRQVRAKSSEFSTVASVDATTLVVADDIYRILDRALGGEEVGGSDWYQLATFAASHDYFYLSPSNTGEVAHRLIEELARSLGPAYILRFEALHLLASQTRAKDALADQLMLMFEDQTTGAVGDAVSLILRAAPPVRDEILKRMNESDSPMVRQSRAWLGDVLRDRRPAAEPQADRAAVAALADQLCAGLPKWAMAHIECVMTMPLVMEALGGRTRLRRHEASLLLMLAGVQEPLGTRILDAIETTVDPLLRTRLANLLEYQVPGVEPSRIDSLARIESEPEARRALWGARGHVLMPIPVTDEITRRLADPSSTFAVSYALGISGSIDQATLDRDGLPEDARGVLNWWHARGPALLV